MPWPGEPVAGADETVGARRRRQMAVPCLLYHPVHLLWGAPQSGGVTATDGFGILPRFKATLIHELPHSYESAPELPPSGVLAWIGRSMWQVVLGVLASLVAATVIIAVTRGDSHDSSSTTTSQGSGSTTTVSRGPRDANVECSDNHVGSPV
jgi:hypothetical protein